MDRPEEHALSEVDRITQAVEHLRDPLYARAELRANGKGPRRRNRPQTGSTTAVRRAAGSWPCANAAWVLSRDQCATPRALRSDERVARDRLVRRR